jgi:hypothetical protein
MFGYAFVDVLVYRFVLCVAVLNVSVKEEREACCWQQASAVTT